MDVSSKTDPEACALHVTRTCLPLEFAVLPRHIHLRYRSTAEMATLQFDLMQWC